MASVRSRETMGASNAEEPRAKRGRSDSDRRNLTEIRSQRQFLKELPPALFSRVLQFLGPTSQSLIAISFLNKKFHRTMAAIGTTMQPRAQVHFRIPLQPKKPIESAISLFVRHTRTYSKVLGDLALLTEVVSRTMTDIDTEDIGKALTIAIDLLEVSPALSEVLEKQILSACGKCGGKVFKYCKWEKNIPTRSTLSVKGQENHTKTNQERMEMSQGIMKTVVHRGQQSSSLNSSSGSFNQKHNGLNFQSTGCH